MGEDNVCVLQYVLFPPHHRTIVRGRIHDDSTESDKTRDNKGGLQIVTEIFVEPQHGTVSDQEAGLHYIRGLTYYEFPKKVSHHTFLDS